MKTVKIAAVLLVFILVLVSIVSNAYHVFIALAVFMILPILFFVYTRYCAKHVKILLYPKKKTVTVDDNIPMTLEIRNDGLLPMPNIRVLLICRNGFLENVEEQSVTASVSGGKIRLIDFFVKSEHSGRIKFRIEKATIFDPVCMFKKEIAISQRATVFALPDCDVKTIPDFSMSSCFSEEDVFSKEKSGYDSSEIFGIRSYRQGDMPRQIHWKLSARLDELMVKEFSLPINDRFILFADFYAEEFTERALFGIDDMLYEMFSLSFGLVQQNIFHSIWWYDYKLGAVTRRRVQTVDDAYKAMQEVLGMTAYSGLPVGREYCPKGNGIFYFSPEEDRNGERRVAYAK